MSTSCPVLGTISHTDGDDMTMVQSTATIRVLIVDDQELIREGLGELISRCADITVVGKASGGAEALAMFREHEPDVTLVDLRMAPMDGIETVEAIRQE